MLLLKPGSEDALLAECCFMSGPGGDAGRDAGADRVAGGAVIDGETGLSGDSEATWRRSDPFVWFGP